MKNLDLPVEAPLFTPTDTSLVTLTDKPLFTPEQLANYNRDGFIVLRGLYDVNQVQLLSDWTEEIVARPLERDKLMVYFEDNLLKKGERIVSRIERFAKYHESFDRFINDTALLGRASQLLNAPAVVFKEKINFKLPGSDGFKAHQDIQAGWDDYVDFFVTALVAIDDSTVENGCLELAAGHHRRGWIGRRSNPLEGSELEGIEFKKYPMAPGDVAFFDCYTPHQSAPNRGTSRRRNLYVTYNRASSGDYREKYYADKCKSYPPDFEREAGKAYRFKV